MIIGAGTPTWNVEMQKCDLKGDFTRKSGKCLVCPDLQAYNKGNDVVV